MERRAQRVEASEKRPYLICMSNACIINGERRHTHNPMKRVFFNTEKKKRKAWKRLVKRPDNFNIPAPPKAKVIFWSMIFANCIAKRHKIDTRKRPFPLSLLKPALAKR